MLIFQGVPNPSRFLNFEFEIHFLGCSFTGGYTLRGNLTLAGWKMDHE